MLCNHVALGRFYISGERVNRDLACKFVLDFQPRAVRGNHEWIGERLRIKRAFQDVSPEEQRQLEKVL